MKTNENETIICLNGCKYDMSKENLRIVKTKKNYLKNYYRLFNVYSDNTL